MLRLKRFLLPLFAILLMASVVAYILTGEFGTVPSILAGVSLAALLAALFASFDEVRKVLMRRTTKYASGAGLYIVILVAVIAAINYIGVKRSWRVDLTDSKLYSLTDKSEKLVAGMKQDVGMVAFFQEGTPERTNAEDLLREYEHASKGRIRVEFVDPYKNPARAKEAGVTVLGTLILESGGNQTKIEESTEEAVTNALVKVSSDKRPVIYFIKGHGEKDVDDSEAEGYSQVKKALEDENYVVRPLALVQEEQVPEDAAVVVVAGPKMKYFEQEQARLQNFMEAGGRLLLLLDPESEGWSGWVKEWGVEIGDAVIIDPLAKLLGADYTIPLVSQYGEHEIVKGFKYATFFPSARPVKTATTLPSGVSAVKLAETTPQSWAETNPSKPKLDEGDEKGPLSLSVVVSKSIKGSIEKTEVEEGEARASEESGEKEVRIVVVGDSDFGANAYVHLSANLNLVLNMVSWLSRREALISIREKTPGFRSISLSTAQMRNISLLSLVFIPGAMVLAGFYTWWHRRNL